MFWVRLKALRPMLDANFDEWEFEPEAGQIDGTFAHAIERVFALSVLDQRLRVESADAITGEFPAPAPRSYPYAKRS
jgi:lipopolysaccharide biosynthesis protein